MELEEVANPQFALPVVGVIVCVFLVFAFGFRPAAEPPNFDFEAEEKKSKKHERRRPGTTGKKLTNGVANGHAVPVVEEPAKQQSPRIVKQHIKQENKSPSKVKVVKKVTPVSNGKPAAKLEINRKSVSEKHDDKDAGEWETKLSRREKKLRKKEEAKDGMSSEENCDDEVQPDTKEEEKKAEDVPVKEVEQKKGVFEESIPIKNDELFSEPYETNVKEIMAEPVENKPQMMVTADAGKQLDEGKKTLKKEKKSKKKEVQSMVVNKHDCSVQEEICVLTESTPVLSENAPDEEAAAEKEAREKQQHLNDSRVDMPAADGKENAEEEEENPGRALSLARSLEAHIITEADREIAEEYRNKKKKKKKPRASASQNEDKGDTSASRADVQERLSGAKQDVENGLVQPSHTFPTDPEMVNIPYSKELDRLGGSVVNSSQEPPVYKKRSTPTDPDFTNYKYS